MTDLRTLIVRVTYAGGDPPNTLHLEAIEYARVGVDRTIQVMSRGWGGFRGMSEEPDIQISQISQEALHSLLPCNAEETDEEQEWEMIQHKLKRYGVEVTLDELRQTPVVVEIEERLVRLITRFSVAQTRIRE